MDVEQEDYQMLGQEGEDVFDAAAAAAAAAAAGPQLGPPAAAAAGPQLGPPAAAQVPARLRLLADTLNAAGRTVQFVGDAIILVATTDAAASGFPASGGIYTEVNQAIHFSAFPNLAAAGPAPAPAPGSPAGTVPVRLSGDELVTYDGHKRGAEAEAFMFLAKRLISLHSLSIDLYAPRMFKDEARAWFVKLLQLHAARGTVLTWDALWDEFTACYMFDRHPNWEVRQTLLSRRYVQRTDQSVADYMVHFRHTILMATDLSETDQVSWFLAGLVPEIAAECQTDALNKPYTVLQSLYEAARSVELRHIALGKRTVRGSTGHVSLNKNTSAGHYMRRPRNAGIRKSDSRFPNTAANSDKGPQGSSGRKQYRAGPSRPRSSAGRRPAARARPAKTLSPELQAWLDYCYHGHRCHRCGQTGHDKRNCRSRTPLTEDSWARYITENPNA